MGAEPLHSSLKSDQWRVTRMCRVKSRARPPDSLLNPFFPSWELLPLCKQSTWEITEVGDQQPLLPKMQPHHPTRNPCLDRLLQCPKWAPSLLSQASLPQPTPKGPWIHNVYVKYLKVELVFHTAKVDDPPPKPTDWDQAMAYHCPESMLAVSLFQPTYLLY